VRPAGDHQDVWGLEHMPTKRNCKSWVCPALRRERETEILLVSATAARHGEEKTEPISSWGCTTIG